MARARFSSDIARDLVDLLRRVHEQNEMTQEEADVLAVGALTIYKPDKPG